MNASRLSITLNKGQVARLLRDARAHEETQAVILGLGPPAELLLAAQKLMDDAHDRYPRSLVRGMVIFASFPADGKLCSVTELARRLKMSSSGVHRYIMTLVELGLLERDPKSRKYRRPTLVEARRSPPAS